MKSKFKTLVIAVTTIWMPAASFAATMKADINGLVCAFCAQSLEKVFMKQPEVEKIKVDLDSRLITINFKNEKSLSAEKADALIRDAGYSATNFRIEP